MSKITVWVDPEEQKKHEEEMKVIFAKPDWMKEAGKAFQRRQTKKIIDFYQNNHVRPMNPNEKEKI